MASVSLKTSAGISGAATPTKARSVSLVTQAGLSSATGRVEWGGSDSPLSRVPWLPKAGTPLMLVDGQGRQTNQLAPAWDRALRWLFEQYIGGINAPTVAQITTDVAQTQTQVAATSNYAQQVSAYASGIAATATATAAVSLSNGLSGAGSIPDTPDPPTPPGTSTQ